jgi:hypothetical protein
VAHFTLSLTGAKHGRRLTREAFAKALRKAPPSTGGRLRVGRGTLDLD